MEGTDPSSHGSEGTDRSSHACVTSKLNFVDFSNFGAIRVLYVVHSARVTASSEHTHEKQKTE